MLTVTLMKSIALNSQQTKTIDPTSELQMFKINKAKKQSVGDMTFVVNFKCYNINSEFITNRPMKQKKNGSMKKKMVQRKKKCLRNR